jgi:hypothetical protein
MIHPERGVTIETWAVVSDATSVEYLVSRDGEAVEFSLGQSSRTSGLSLLVTPDGLRRCLDTFRRALAELDARCGGAVTEPPPPADRG